MGEEAANTFDEIVIRYAEHCFDLLDHQGVKPDRSKGKKVENLRYGHTTPTC